MNIARLVSSALVGLVLAVLISNDARADGCYFPEAAFATLPTVPTQRALIAWRNGVETLVVESAFDTPSPGVAWIVPLPAEPTKLEAADPGLLTSLAMSQQPKVTHDLWAETKGLLGVLAFLLILSLCLIVHRSWLWITFVVLVLLCCLGFPAANYSGVRGGDGGMEFLVTEEQKVGHYDVSVLRAKDAGAISGWLSAHGSKPLDARAAEIASDYISHGWCFVVARLTREHGGAATPHPLAATFPVGQPVYPMKLTQLAGSTTNVQLFVVADRQAVADGFRTQAADRYSLIEGSPPNAMGSFYDSATTDLVIGSPDACDYLWHGCVVTTLSGRLTPEQMKQDVGLSLTTPDYHRDHVYSTTGRSYVAIMIFLCGGIVAIGYLGVICRNRRRPGAWELNVLGALVVATLVVAGIVCAALPVVPTKTGAGLNGFRDERRVRDAAWVLRAMAEKGKLSPPVSDAQWLAFGDELANSGEWPRPECLNPLTDRPMTFERTPGNYSKRTIDGKTFLCLYDLHGREYRLDLVAYVERAKSKKPQ